jgi:peptide/nickel transport system permease protein
MLRYILKRLIYSIFVLFGVSVIIFLLIHMAPGDPVDLMVSEDASVEQKALIREKYGLDKSLPEQYIVWIGRVLSGDLGESFYYRMTNWDLITNRLPATALLALSAFALSLIVAIPLGLIAGVRKGSVIDVGAMLFALIGQALSPVWIGLVLILVFGVQLGWFPVMGMGSIKNLIMPSITLGLPMSALVTRLLRSNMIEVLQEDYITAALAKGARPKKVYFRYAMKNAVIPVITVSGMQLATYLGGAVTTEQIFSWPGLGTLTIQAINTRDFTLVQAIILITSFMLVFINLLVDILYTLVDPRLNFSEMG